MTTTFATNGAERSASAAMSFDSDYRTLLNLNDLKWPYIFMPKQIDDNALLEDMDLSNYVDDIDGEVYEVQNAF